MIYPVGIHIAHVVKGASNRVGKSPLETEGKGTLVRDSTGFQLFQTPKVPKFQFQITSANFPVTWNLQTLQTLQTLPDVSYYKWGVILSIETTLI